MPTPDAAVVLAGMMGSGKTAVGRRVAARLGCPYLDNDDRLLAATGMTPRDYARTAGLEALHRLETDLLAEALDHAPCVAAAAGGVVEDEEGRRLLAAAFVVWLRASPETLLLRARSGSHRPALGSDPEQAFADLARLRAPAYAAAADVVIGVDALDVEAVAAAVHEALLERADPPVHRRGSR